MSQVYANNTIKYYDLPGLTQYLLTIDQPIANNTITFLKFNTLNPDTDNFEGIIQKNSTGTRFNILKSGMYSIILNVEYKTLDNTIPPAIPFINNTEVFISLSRPPEFSDLKIAHIKNTTPPQSSTTEFNVSSLSCITYLRAGDIINLFFETLQDDIDIITTVLKSNSSLIISRIN